MYNETNWKHMKDLNVRDKTTKILEENMSKYSSSLDSEIVS